MAKVNLRAYHNEIDNMINRGQHDEAVAHCKYILQVFPKSVDTYRLLGKAYLEAKRYTDATDIFLRVLSAAPDDFVSHLGLSIIREDEGNLDASIWHMERAFEIQPFNNALQEELRRLFERRDGSAPPRIRLTRAALARMYAKGNLYQQAIAETRAVLTRDPQRIDMRLLLGLMYLKTGKNIEAAEISTKVLQKIPYCIEANRILVRVLSDSDHKDDYKTYKSRLIALDPYEIQKPDDILSTQMINNDVVQLEKLDVDTSTLMSSEEQADWMTSLGLSPSDSESLMDDDLPDWLIAASTQVFVDDVLEEDENIIQNQLLDGEVIVESEGDIDMIEWLGESVEDETTEFIPPTESIESRDFTEYLEDTDIEAVVTKSDEDSSDISEIDAEELPEWLMGLAPDDLESQDSLVETQQSDLEDLNDIDVDLDDIIGEKAPSILSEDSDQPVEDVESIISAEVPEWLNEFDESAPTSEEIQASVVEPNILDEGTTPAIQDPDSELPEWLREFDEEEKSGEFSKTNDLDDVPEWLREIGDEVDQDSSIDTPIVNEIPKAFENETSPQDKTDFEEPPDFDDADQALAWLAGFAATQEITNDLEEAEKSSQESIESVSPTEEDKVDLVEQESQYDETYEVQVAGTADESIEAVSKVESIDLNQASLIEIERLPGVGYVIAQNIISYRETHGNFTSVENLADVPGIEPDDLFELRKYFYVAEPTLKPETKKEDPAKLKSARKAWSDGDTQAALDHYQDLIKQQASLDDVIFDLNKLLQNKGEDIELWQTLGDAYMRNNQLIEAMQAYNKAEELLK